MLERYLFLAALPVAVSLGVWVPQGGDALRESGFLLKLLVGATLFISGFTLNTSRLARQLANFRAIALALSTTYVVAPVLAYGLAHLAADPASDAEARLQFVEAVMIAAAQAGTLASAIALTMAADGDQELALVLTVASNTLTAFLTPLVLEVSLGAMVSFPLGDMILGMTLVVFLPVGLGQVARRLLGDRAAAVIPRVRPIPSVVILIFVYTGVAAAATSLLQQPTVGLRFLVVCIALHVVLLVWSDRAGACLRLSGAARMAVTLCGAQKTLPNGIYLWEAFFGANPFGAVPLVLYHLFQLVADTALAAWWKRP